MRQVFLDTETTGLSPESGDRVVEIGSVEMVNRRLSGQHRHYYLNPERKNSEDAFKVHGLSDEFLAAQPLFASVAEELLAFLDGAEIVIHNAAFDIGFLDAELRRCKRPTLSERRWRVTDSLTLARESYPGKSNSLDALCRRLEVDNSNRTLHGALLDAGLLAVVYLRMSRGHHALAMEMAREADGGIVAVAIDFSQFTLAVLEPDDDERAAHAALLAQLDKASGGKTLWPLDAQGAVP